MYICGGGWTPPTALSSKNDLDPTNDKSLNTPLLSGEIFQYIVVLKAFINQNRVFATHVVRLWLTSVTSFLLQHLYLVEVMNCGLSNFDRIRISFAVTGQCCSTIRRWYTEKINLTKRFYAVTLFSSHVDCIGH